MRAIFRRPFSEFLKKQHIPVQLAIQDEVDQICAGDFIGKKKAVDLSEFRVHKFKIKSTQYLIAYRPPTTQEIEAGQGQIGFLVIEFFKVGLHENFYNELKKYLKS